MLLLKMTFFTIQKNIQNTYCMLSPVYKNSKKSFLWLLISSSFKDFKIKQKIKKTRTRHSWQRSIVHTWPVMSHRWDGHMWLTFKGEKIYRFLHQSCTEGAACHSVHGGQECSVFSQTTWSMASTKCLKKKLETEQFKCKKRMRSGLISEAEFDKGAQPMRKFPPGRRKMEAFHRIRICGWWVTGAERRVFLPGLAGGPACVCWLGWGTAEEDRVRGLVSFRWGTAALSLLSFPVFSFSFYLFKPFIVLLPSPFSNFAVAGVCIFSVHKDFKPGVCVPVEVVSCVFCKWGAALKPVHPVQTGSPGLKQEVFTGFPLPLAGTETGHLCRTCFQKASTRFTAIAALQIITKSPLPAFY